MILLAKKTQNKERYRISVSKGQFLINSKEYLPPRSGNNNKNRDRQNLPFLTAKESFLVFGKGKQKIEKRQQLVPLIAAVFISAYDFFKNPVFSASTKRNSFIF
jgi:hypothetical protein